MNVAKNSVEIVCVRCGVVWCGLCVCVCVCGGGGGGGGGGEGALHFTLALLLETALIKQLTEDTYMI